MSEPDGLETYLDRPMAVLGVPERDAIAQQAIDPDAATALTEIDRLVDPAPVSAENGWCWLAGGVGYVAARTPMPDVTGEMVDWWFDWHPRESIRYRIWHPAAHRANALDPPARPGAKPHWGAVHHVVEDVGTGVAHARISFTSPTGFGYASDALDDPRVATILSARIADDRLGVTHSRMTHVWLREGEGTVLRSRFWFGSELPRPARRVALPRRLPAAVLQHCLEEYANLATLLPELWCRYGGGQLDRGPVTA